MDRSYLIARGYETGNPLELVGGQLCFQNEIVFLYEAPDAKTGVQLALHSPNTDMSQGRLIVEVGQFLLCQGLQDGDRITLLARRVKIQDVPLLVIAQIL